MIKFDLTHGYYTSLDNALERYIACASDAVSVSDLDSIKQYAELVDKTCTTAITAITRSLQQGGLFEVIEQEKRKKKKRESEADE